MKKLDLAHPVHFQFWTPSLKRQLGRVATFAELTQVFLEVMDRAPEGVIMMSGAISTGGFKDKDLNLKVFSTSI